MITSGSTITNVAWSLVAKIGSISVAIFSVPILLSLIGTEQYGVWVTMTSLITFVSLLDLGVGHSMRNSVASIDDFNGDDVRAEFIGFFRLLAYIGLLAAFGFCLASTFWDISGGTDLAAQLLYLPPLLLLPLMIGNSVLQGARATGLQAVLQASAGWGFFAFIGFLTWLQYKPSINGLAIAWSFFYCSSLVIVFFFALTTLRLSLSQIYLGAISSLPRGRLRVSLEFLILQLSTLFLYSLGNVLILRYLGASEVARYDVINKMYQVGLSLYTIVISVMWPNISRARAQRNNNSLKRIFRILMLTAAAFSLCALLGALAAPAVVKLWTHNKIHIKTSEAMIIGGLVTVQSLAYVGAVFMNAFERLRIQIFFGFISIILMIPLSDYFFSHNYGIVSITIAATVLTALPMITCNLFALRLIHSMNTDPIAEK